MENIYDIIIIGGGTAGMTAAIYGYRSGMRLLIIEKSFFGGQIISTSEIENYPAFPSATGYTFATELHSQLKALDVKQISDEVIGMRKEISSDCWHIVCKKSDYLAKAVIIASGTENRKLGLLGEDKFLGHGLSHCATCDGALYKERPVAVVGGGNTALEEALYLSLLCKKVYLIHRRAVFTGDLALQHRIHDTENIQLLLNSRIIALHGTDRLESIKLCAVSKADDSHTNDDHADDSHKKEAAENDQCTETLNVGALFVAIGQIPQNQPFADVVTLDSHGYIVAGENCHTDAAGVFAAGDCRAKNLRQLVTAASDGAIAATEAVRFINEGVR